MAIPVTTISGAAPVTPVALAAPVASETIANAGNDVLLYVEVGATATTITVVRPGLNAAGDPVADFVIGPLTSTTRFIPIGAEYVDSATGLATVQFSQVTGVLSRLLRV